MEKKFETLLKIKYGSLNPKVNLEPDFFTGFDPARRKEIVTEEAAFYHGSHSRIPKMTNWKSIMNPLLQKTDMRYR